MLLYSASASVRLNYITNFIKSIIGEAIIITTDKEQFLQATQPKINYSNERICADEYQILPHNLLFQNTIDAVELVVTNCRNQPCFFTNANDNHGFDILAATFYLISRYEEYLPYEKDNYGRYSYTNSLAFKHSFLHLPLVNIWLHDLCIQLQKKFPLFTFHFSLFTFSPTYDVDIAYAYQYQPLYKNVGGFFKDLMKGDFEKITERATVYTNQQKDPFDNFDWLDVLHKKYKLTPKYFFLLAEKRSAYDKNNSPKSSGIKQLIQQQAKKYEVGIHPSWQSGDDKKLLKNEIKQLEKNTNNNCKQSRQHYLRFTLPETYRRLINEGIEQDFSMGYGAVNGFRASVASPFFWYDLLKDEQTLLLLSPFCFMDATCIFNQQQSASEAGQELQQYYDVVKAVDGELITIFHNHFLTQQPQFIAWRNMYESFLSINNLDH